MSKKFDVAIIGGGPGGYSAAIRLAQLGASVVLFEKEKLGGTCLNVGCIPTKTLLEKADLIEKIKKETLTGIFKDAGFFSWSKIIKEKDSIINTLTGGVKSILKSYDVTVINKEVQLTSGKVIQDIESNEIYEANKIIIATGTSTLLPPIDGIRNENIITSTEALDLKKIPGSLVIIGGGVIGVEIACIYAAFGTKVTIIEMQNSILEKEDKEIVSYLCTKLKEKGVEILTDSKVQSIDRVNDKNSVKCVNQKNELTFKRAADYVLIAIGRKPNLENIESDNLGLKLQNGFIWTDDTMQTNVENIYAIGDITGQFLLAHVAYEQAVCAAENIMGIGRTIDLSKVPRCIYTHPQIAAIGLTENQLISMNKKFNKSIYPFAANGKALTMKEDGFIKWMSDPDTDEILGVSLIGSNATELLNSVIVALNGNIKTKEIGEMIFPHPTLSEMIKEVALMNKNEAIHLPKSMNKTIRSSNKQL
jgi:dihydrolipoamide dehydrogenase